MHTPATRASFALFTRNSKSIRNGVDQELENLVQLCFVRRIDLEDPTFLHHLLIAPIRHLPDDVLSYIFLICLPNSTDGTSSDIDAALTDADVYKAWKNCALLSQMTSSNIIRACTYMASNLGFVESVQRCLLAGCHTLVSLQHHRVHDETSLPPYPSSPTPIVVDDSCWSYNIPRHLVITRNPHYHSLPLQNAAISRSTLTLPWRPRNTALRVMAGQVHLT